MSPPRTGASSSADTREGEGARGAVRVSVEGGVATLTLDRPGSLNALTVATFRELRDLFRALGQEHVDDNGDAQVQSPGRGDGFGDVRAVLLTGAGDGFCSGADVEVLGTLLGKSGAEILAVARLANETVLAMRQLRKPIIAAVNGVAVGAGAALALAADFRIASEQARFGFVFSRLGLSGAEMGCTWLLPRLIGHARATELLMLGDIIDAPTAERYGLVSQVVPHGELARVTGELATRLASGPTFAYGMTKLMLDRDAGVGLAEALEAEAHVQQICSESQDFRAAYRALQRKRRPRFSGR